MIDERRIIVERLLHHYKHRVDGIEMPKSGNIPILIKTIGDRDPRFFSFEHNEGIDYILEYIRHLEKKVEELQYVQSIIDVAKREVKHDLCK